ncbi:hypothetical protein LAZ67_2006021 [Cordylochernes scorpioides]|uniref:Integrase catalytic domain-containing protein n=1 Tax=Cordylochernes scorpioides TaxID=51811 RepID=A0ABY6K5U3_9ARAC|nr:hypothetical protein LAZ67_2006021 [Cordylochernes scorpioides]
MYTLNLSRLPETTHVTNEHCLISKDNSRTAWHRRLGHPSDNKLDLILKNNLLKGLDSINGTLDQCDACSLGKMTKVPYVHTDSNQESYPFEAIYVDLCGPMRINSLGGSKYFLTIVDGFSRRIFVEFLKDKLSAAEVLKKFIVKRENELNSKLKRLRTDNGTEFINKNLETFIESKGIKHELTTPYTPRSNGRVERANRTLLDKGRTLLADSQLPLHFWAEAVNTAAYLYNLTATTNDPDTTPMEKWKARVIIETADIHFRENNNVISEEKQSDNNTDTDTYFFFQEDEQLDNHVLSDVDIEEPAPDTMINRQTESSGSDRPQRTRTIPKRFDDYVLATTNETIPKDYEEAIACEDKKHWENAMLEEIQNMYSHQVWELVPRPVNAKVVKSKWVFKISKDQENKTYKARLVAMGYNQIVGRYYKESFSPVIKNATLRTILSMAATKDSVIKLFDVKAAYLNGNIENTIFMEQPAGFVQDRNKVCKLNKSIYGLPQSGRSWYEKFSQVLHDCGLEKLKSDPCLFKWKNEDKYFYVGIYVDDFITVSDSEDTSNRFINKLRHHLVADIFTKDLSRDQMKKHLENLSIVGIKTKHWVLMVRRRSLSSSWVVDSLASGRPRAPQHTVYCEGPKTIFFWAPTFKWALVIAGIGDLQRPAEKLSLYQSSALAATGIIWSRYSMVIIPKNYNLLSVNIFVAATGLYQLLRIYRYQVLYVAVSQAKAVIDDHSFLERKPQKLQDLRPDILDPLCSLMEKRFFLSAQNAPLQLQHISWTVLELRPIQQPQHISWTVLELRPIQQPQHISWTVLELRPIQQPQHISWTVLELRPIQQNYSR